MCQSARSSSPDPELVPASQPVVSHRLSIISITPASPANSQRVLVDSSTSSPHPSYQHPSFPSPLPATKTLDPHEFTCVSTPVGGCERIIAFSHTHRTLLHLCPCTQCLSPLTQQQPQEDRSKKEAALKYHTLILFTTCQWRKYLSQTSGKGGGF